MYKFEIGDKVYHVDRTEVGVVIKRGDWTLHEEVCIGDDHDEDENCYHVQWGPDPEKDVTFEIEDELVHAK